jgi:hypothetical protein
VAGARPGDRGLRPLPSPELESLLCQSARRFCIDIVGCVITKDGPHRSHLSGQVFVWLISSSTRRCATIVRARGRSRSARRGARQPRSFDRGRRQVQYRHHWRLAVLRGWRSWHCARTQLPADGLVVVGEMSLKKLLSQPRGEARTSRRLFALRGHAGEITFVQWWHGP